MKFGLSSYTYGWAVGVPGHDPAKPMDEHALLKEVCAHGFRLLQIGDNLPLENFDDSRLLALKEAADRNHIELEIGARGLTADRIQLYAGIARKLGAEFIRFVIDDPTSGYRPDIERIIEVLTESLASLRGLWLGLENHDRFAAAQFRHIVDKVAAENVGICLDTANSLGAGEGLETVVAALAPVTFNLHIKDFEAKRLPHMMGFTVTGCPAGTGLVDLPRLLEHLRPFGRCRSAILEQWTVPENDLASTIAKERDWAETSLAYLKPLFT